RRRRRRLRVDSVRSLCVGHHRAPPLPVISASGKLSRLVGFTEEPSSQRSQHVDRRGQAAQSFCVPALGTCRDGRYPDTWTTTKLSIPPTRPAGPERRTNHRLRKLIDQMQAGIAENRLDLLRHAHRLNELTKEIAELRRQQREPVGKG